MKMNLKTRMSRHKLMNASELEVELNMLMKAQSKLSDLIESVVKEALRRGLDLQKASDEDFGKYFILKERK